MTRLLAMDFEYNTNTTNGYLKPVCVSIQFKGGKPQSYWLLGDGLSKFKIFMEELYWEDCIILSWQAAAEARALLALDIHPMAYRWIDLRLDFLMLYNSNFDAMEGDYLKKGGYLDTMTVYSGAKMPANLLNAKFKMLGQRPVPGYKDEMRNLILSKSEFTGEEAKQIMEYCESDIVDLFAIDTQLKKKIGEYLTDEDMYKFDEQRLVRSDYSVLSALMEHQGYPLNVEGARAVYENKEKYLSAIREAFNQKYPDIGLFELKKGKWTTKKSGKQNLAEYLLDKYPSITDWPETSPGSGVYSWDKKLVLDNYFQIKNGWSTDNPGQFFHYYRVQDSAFNSFKRPEDEKDESKKGKTFFAQGNITTDNRMHPWMNPFGSKTSRSQPPATTFIFGKTAWLRSLVQPIAGRSIIEIDYGGQELFLQGLIAKDESLIYDYLQKDFYMQFAKRCDSDIPADATKATHSEQRAVYKVAALGIGYGMGAKKLASHITLATGIEITSNQAQTIIRMFEVAYPDYIRWKKEIVNQYKSDGYLQLKSGWTMFGGNTKHFKQTSIPNFPIQGAGADIMRSAVTKCYEDDVDVIFTLHDALFVECDNEDLAENLRKLSKAMRLAFMEYFDGHYYSWLTKGIKLDAHIWSPDYTGSTLKYLSHPDSTKLRMKQDIIEGDITLCTSEAEVMPFFVDERAISQLKLTGNLVFDEEQLKKFKEIY